MKSKFITLSISLFFLALFCTPSYAVNTPVKNDVANSIELTKLYGVAFNHDITLTLEDVMSKSRKEIEHKLNTKLSFKQKMALKFSKYKIKRLEKSGADVVTAFPADSGGFHLGSFLLGIFLSLLGVLISWILWGRRGLKYSLYGFLVGILIGVVSFRI